MIEPILLETLTKVKWTNKRKKDKKVMVAKKWFYRTFRVSKKNLMSKMTEKLVKKPIIKLVRKAKTKMGKKRKQKKALRSIKLEKTESHQKVNSKKKDLSLLRKIKLVSRTMKMISTTVIMFPHF